MKEVADPSAFLSDEQTGIFQNPDVVHHRDAGGLKLLGHISHRTARFAFHDIQDATPGSVAECVKDGAHVIHKRKNKFTY